MRLFSQILIFRFLCCGSNLGLQSNLLKNDIWHFIYICIYTYDFLQKINQIDCAPHDSYLVSLDVKSLCTIISNAEGIKSVKTSLEKYSKRSTSTKVITTSWALILTINNFIFNCKNYLQIKGCAMRTICADLYASIFMHHFVKKFIYPFIKTFSLIYLRFVGAIFLYGQAVTQI